MIWMGEEFGDCTDINANEKNQQLEWSLLNNDRNRNLLEYYKGLIALRKQNPALFTSNLKFFHENPDSKVFAYERWNDEGSRVVIVALVGTLLERLANQVTVMHSTRLPDV